MSRRQVLTEEELRKKYQKEHPEQADKIDELFDTLEKTNEATEEMNEETNKEAIKTYKDLIVQQTEEVKLNSVWFKFRKHATALEFEERQLITEPKDKLAHIHTFLIEPQMPLSDFLQLPPEIPKYIEQKIMEHFIQGLVQIALQNSPSQELAD